ncbi:MAG TPA: SDR family NAD(P)-dependent oxidoreductase, partial [Puia sp.]|nr:SDR family NAD(P)-dependent oxidoreductase [Puia sp.]
LRFFVDESVRRLRTTRKGICYKGDNKKIMARIFITGSADGLGQMAAKLLVSQGHTVVLHARNAERGREALGKVPGAEKVLTADLSSMEETKLLAAEANELGRFDAIIHNAGVYHSTSRDHSPDGLPLLFAVNSMAPYILTSLIQRPERLVYLSSGMHMQGNPRLEALTFETIRAGHSPTYSDTKLYDLILCKAVARKWPDVYANAVDPGWVPTKMGGRNAPDNLEKGYETQAWLAVSDDSGAKVSGRYFFHQKDRLYLRAADDVAVQEQFLALCARLSGVRFTP